MEMKCNFRYYEQLCYLKLEQVSNGYIEHGKCDGEENCALFVKMKRKPSENEMLFHYGICLYQEAVKPLCHEICADPDLVCEETEELTRETRQREQIRIATCPFKNKYRCKWVEKNALDFLRERGKY